MELYGWYMTPTQLIIELHYTDTNTVDDTDCQIFWSRLFLLVSILVVFTRL